MHGPVSYRYEGHALADGMETYPIPYSLPTTAMRTR